MLADSLGLGGLPELSEGDAGPWLVGVAAEEVLRRVRVTEAASFIIANASAARRALASWFMVRLNAIRSSELTGAEINNPSVAMLVFRNLHISDQALIMMASRSGVRRMRVARVLYLALAVGVVAGVAAVVPGGGEAAVEAWWEPVGAVAPGAMAVAFVATVSVHVL